MMDVSILNLKAICAFCATGFFLDQDTYYENEVFHLDKFPWFYTPRTMTFCQAVDEFSQLFETITREQLDSKRVILALSGGLDSRTQAVALKGRSNVVAYSYQFCHSFNENKYGEAIASRMNVPFFGFTIPQGYLWQEIDKLAQWNECNAEFTAPRQMAIADEFRSMGDVFYLGHWGDVLFDDMGVPDNLPFDNQVDVVINKIVKKSGFELADTLWKNWQLDGTFRAYIFDRIRTLLQAIPIDNANARIRAFKSLYWLPRWTKVNLCVFEQFHPVALPYCDERMWNFICSIPETYLAGRQIQIEYIKRKAPELARIPWQPFNPCNLYNYQQYHNFPFNAQVFTTKVIRRICEMVSGQRCVERNWELQFIGQSNNVFLSNYLLKNDAIDGLVPKDIRKFFFDKFYNGDANQQIWYAHSISMLLTLSLFAIKFHNEYNINRDE